MDNINEKLTKKRGYYELNIDNLNSFKELIQPDKAVLRSLMTTLNYSNEPKQNIIHPIIGDITVPEPIIKDEIIFRGQANKEWSLTPSLFRSGELNHISNPSNFILEEYEKLLEFEKLCDLTGVQIPGDSFSKRKSQQNIISNYTKNHLMDFWHDDFIEVAAFAQHFGIETSLLDWSRNILTACYFASVSAMSEMLKNKNFCTHFSIWVLNNKYLDENFIKFVEPPKSLNNHIAHQQGVLTLAKIIPEIVRLQNTLTPQLHSEKDFSLEGILNFYQKDHLLLKLNIPIILASDVFSYCDAYNFNACNLFRGVQGAVQHFKDQKIEAQFNDLID